MNPRIKAISGLREGSGFPFLDNETTAGRGAENDIVLKDPLTSKRHFAFWQENGKLYFRHLGTRNGVRVDGEERLRGELREGSRIQCGSTIFVCLIQDKVPQKLERATSPYRGFCISLDLLVYSYWSMRENGLCRRPLA